MHHPQSNARRTGCGRTASILAGAVAGFMLTTAVAQEVKIRPITVEVSGTVDMAALPQISADQIPQGRVALPYLTPVDPTAFAAAKALAKTRSVAHSGPTFGAPMMPQNGPNTVNPAELVFTGTGNAACGAVSGFSVTPADQGLAVGDTLVGVLQGINICLSVFDKNGTLQAGFPKATGTFFTLGALNNSDPRMIYDWINHRYFFVVISYPSSCGTFCLTPAFYNLAVSNADDPTGTWCLYKNIAVVSGPNPDGSGHYLLPDFPRLGQDRQAIYLASNLYRGNSYVDEEVLALNKTPMFSCTTTTGNAFTGITPGAVNGFTIQPANVFSPADQPKSMYFISSFFGSDNRLAISALHSPLSSPTFSRVIITTTNSYSLPPNATQQGSASLIDSGDTRMSGSAYYASGSIYGAIATDGGNSEPGMIMYQVQPYVDTSGGANDGKITSAKILNETTHFGTGTLGFYYPAQQPDGEGNVTTVFSYSSSTNFPSLAWATRRAAQTPGTWPDNGVTAMAGAGSYTGGRWGDYWATAPAGIVSGGGTGGFPKFWFAGMFATAGNNWSTAIGRTGYTAITQD